jgi:hypothetical protein
MSICYSCGHHWTEENCPGDSGAATGEENRSRRG